MKGFSLFAAVLALGLSMNMPEAEAAKRLGGGSSSGMQRQMNTTPNAPTTTPMQTPASPAAASAARSPAGAAAPAAQPKRSWMGPLAGLAAGLGLAALASHLGFGEELASMMMIGLLVMAVLMVVGLIMRRRAAAQQPAMAGAGAGAGGMQYSASAPAQRSYDAAPSPAASAAPAAAAAVAPAAAGIPAEFDVDGFVRQAKVNFIRLQASHDAGDLDDLREFTTPEMFAELKAGILSRTEAAQQTDVLEINAQVLEVAEEGSRYIVSVLFSGLLREDRDAAPEQINEIWHLAKPREGNGGWRLAGIQQTQ